MRNVFLTLVLGNVLLLAWQYWVDPAPATLSATGTGGSLVLFGSEPSGSTGQPAASPSGLAKAARGVEAGPRFGKCLGLGPVEDVAAAQQAGAQLAARGIDATPIARETQVWLGHWVQIAGFASLPDAEAARRRLVAGGIVDAYLMQDGAQPMLSLGVFRDRGRANRVARVAGSLGFQAAIRDRYRPTVERWLLIRPRPDQMLEPSDLSLVGDRIMRSEAIPCESGATSSPPASDLPVTRQAGQTL